MNGTNPAHTIGSNTTPTLNGCEAPNSIDEITKLEMEWSTLATTLDADVKKCVTSKQEAEMSLAAAEIWVEKLKENLHQANEELNNANKAKEKAWLTWMWKYRKTLRAAKNKVVLQG